VSASSIAARHESVSSAAGVAACGDDELALYIHWPFCVSKCPYCDFNSHVRASVDHDAWREALLADLAHEAEMTRGARLVSIFFGGGTPSLMQPATVAALVEAATASWSFAEGIEITLEANPNSTEASRFADIASAGVNRVSLGIQSFDDNALRFLGRAHDAAEAERALHEAQRAFKRVSFDLIYALPEQQPASWARELDHALSFATGHLSLYQLTIEPGTRFSTLAANGVLRPLEPDLAAELYELTQERTQAAGLPAYEISNHARPGQESRHNLAYWRYRPYCGIGPGAHGRRAGAATMRHRKPENWLAALGARNHGIASEQPIEAGQRDIETLLMGLRLREGVDIGRLASGALDNEAVNTLVGAGLLELDGTRLRASQRGMLLLDSILARIIR
jgi:oxygen-independent coproporphyrinogen-3 oxidase